MTAQHCHRRTHNLAARRVWAARCALLAWVVGLELLPNLHLWHHRPQTHSHTAGGTQWVVKRGDTELAPHVHRDGSLHDPVQDLSVGTSEGSKLRAASESQHRADGLAHRALALMPAPLPPRLPERTMCSDIVIALPQSETLCQPDELAPSARGPPAALVG
jgi:hypothetical protein